MATERNAWTSCPRWFKVQFQGQRGPFWVCVAVRVAALISSPLTPYFSFLLTLAIARVQKPSQRRKQTPLKPPTGSPSSSRDNPVLQKAQEHFCCRSRFECDVAVQFCRWNRQCKGEQHRNSSFRYFFGYFLGTFLSLRGSRFWKCSRQQNPESFYMTENKFKIMV